MRYPVQRLFNSLANEEARLNALRDLRLLDTPPSEAFDRLTRLASQLLSAPVSIHLVCPPATSATPMRAMGLASPALG